ncbi:hypothetical protein C8A05DRAFT_47074 [Staphylotrichum tortipilum]|uniref:Aminoglycoside phosphotransferase domain-containing protein n=1 Tax=Staphylotrichum tortipilum TaxID=2831512 RepID=A0AAN6RPI6_9PEZI|nr:hypothetical protein C8A05DRAFT_47074 [Staphylotrichum longicolle]
MEYVRQHTSLPVPGIINVQELGEEARSETLRQLRSHFEHLHQLRPDVDVGITSCSGGPVYDHRLDNRSTCGPFRTVAEFHDFLVAPVKKAPRPEWASKYRDRLPGHHEIRFTHADVSWENILVDSETGDVRGILDWEMAGFWPAWWEYRKALFGARSEVLWMNVLKEVMTEYREETEVDMDLEMY